MQFHRRFAILRRRKDKRGSRFRRCHPHPSSCQFRDSLRNNENKFATWGAPVYDGPIDAGEPRSLDEPAGTSCHYLDTSMVVQTRIIRCQVCGSEAIRLEIEIIGTAGTPSEIVGLNKWIRCPNCGPRKQSAPPDSGQKSHDRIYQPDVRHKLAALICRPGGQSLTPRLFPGLSSSSSLSMRSTALANQAASRIPLLGLTVTASKLD